MQVLDAYAHGADRDVQLLEAREQIEEVVRREGQLGRLDAVGREAQGAKGEGGSKGIRCGVEGGAARRRWGCRRRRPGRRGAILDALATELESIGKSFFVGTDELSEALLER